MSTEAVRRNRIIESVGRMAPTGLQFDKTRFGSTIKEDYDVLSGLSSTGASVHSEKVSIHGRSVQAYHITPPDDVEPQGRIVIANGWRNKTRNQFSYIKALSKDGFAVTSFDNIFTSRTITAAQDEAERLRIEGTRHGIEHIKADALKATLDTFTLQDEEDAAIVAHSEGSIYGVLAALPLKDRISYLMLLNPAVLAKKTNLLGISAKGIYANITSRQANLTPQPNDEETKPLDIVQYTVANAGISIAELNAIARLRGEREIEELRQAGVLTANIHGDNDKLFPVRNMLRHRRLFDVFTVVPGGGHEISTNTNGYADAVVGAFHQLKERKKSEMARQGVLFEA